MKTFVSSVAAIVGAALLYSTSALAHSAFAPKRAPAPAIKRSASQPRDDRYQFIPIDIPGMVNVIPVDISNSGIVSGIYDDPQGKTHTFVWNNGHVLTIDYPGAESTFAGAITNNGLLFGNWGSATVQHVGYYRFATQMWTALPDVPGKPVNLGFRINEPGIAVGAACEGTVLLPDKCIAWTWSHANGYSFYQAPGADPNGVGTVPNAINNHGEIIGYSMGDPNLPFDFHSF